MTVFWIEGGRDGTGTASYAGGLINFPDGSRRGVEDILQLAIRDQRTAEGRHGALRSAEGLPALIDTLRSALPRATRLPIPVRLAVSTVRAGLGVIEEGLNLESIDLTTVEIAFRDGETILARMPPDLVSTLRGDRDLAMGVLSRASDREHAETASMVPAEAEAPASLTSIFRYEKRNGRLRRVADERSSKD